MNVLMGCVCVYEYHIGVNCPQRPHVYVNDFCVCIHKYVFSMCVRAYTYSFKYTHVYILSYTYFQGDLVDFFPFLFFSFTSGLCKCYIYIYRHRVDSVYETTFDSIHSCVF